MNKSIRDVSCTAICRSAFRGLVAAALGSVALGLSAVPVGASSTQVSDGHPFSDISFSTTLPQFSPNGLFAVYRQDAEVDGAIELWSVRLNGSAPVRLSDALTPGQGQFLSFAISPDSTRVVYAVDQDVTGKTELFSVPIAGGAITKLSLTLSDDRDVIAFRISPTGNRVIYSADAAAWTAYDLFSVPITGPGGASVQLNPLLAFDSDIDGFQISPDGNDVAFRSGRNATGVWNLYTVPATGGTAVKINGALHTGGSVENYFPFTPDGSRVVYLADATVDGTYDLFSVSVGGGDPFKLNTGLAAGYSVDPTYRVTADGSQVVFRAATPADQVFQLFAAPILGGTVVRLNGQLGAGEDVEADFSLSGSAARVVYRSDEDVNDVIDLYSVPLAGGTSLKLNSALASGGDVLEQAVSPDGTRVVYRADQNTDGLNELFSVPIGGGTATRLNRTLVAGGDVQAYRISPNSAWVVYGADQDTDTVDELMRAPIAGGAVENVSDALVGGGDVVLKFVQANAFDISPTNSYDVLYAADKDVDNQVELYLSGIPEEEVEEDDCTADDGHLCLQNDKFRVSVTWRDFQDRSGQGHATTLSNESGDFWFFNAQSNELIVKIINGCGSTGSYWVFWRALSNVEMDLVIRDTATQQVLTYHNPLGFNSNGHLDIDTLFRCDGSGPAAETVDTSADLPAPGAPQLVERQDAAQIGPCVPNGDRAICLQNGRFRVQGTWSDFNGGSGFAHLIKKNEGSGYAWFFNGNNYEMLFKLVDACSFNGNTWVSIAGLTNVAASLTITDTWTGKIYSQTNALGVDFPTNLDIDTNLDYCGPAPN